MQLAVMTFHVCIACRGCIYYPQVCNRFIEYVKKKVLFSSALKLSLSFLKSSIFKKVRSIFKGSVQLKHVFEMLIDSEDSSQYYTHYCLEKSAFAEMCFYHQTKRWKSFLTGCHYLYKFTKDDTRQG